MYHVPYIYIQGGDKHSAKLLAIGLDGVLLDSRMPSCVQDILEVFVLHGLNSQMLDSHLC